jgi:multicomponent K+:H+ antiporter subunit G
VSPAVAWWLDAATAALVLLGAGMTLVGSLGLLRLGSFFARVHPATLGYTVGTWSLTLATAIQASLVREQPFVNALLVAIFLALTAPVTTIFLMRAAVFRRRVAGREAPPR